MLNLAQAVREQIVKETPPRKGETPKIFTLAALRRMGVWAATAAGALFVAVLSSQGDVGAERLSVALHGGQPQKPRFDAQAETQRLTVTVHALAMDGEQIKTRLASVEHEMDDVTGSISKEIADANAERRFDQGPSVAATAAVTTSIATIAPSPPKAPVPAPVAVQPPPEDLSPPPAHGAYGVDIGSGLTIQALRTRWFTLRAAHPDLFAGFDPIVTVKEVPHGNRVELRLVAGPIVQAGTAAQLCASLAAFGLFCQPTMYDGQRLALR
jgi:hypothetical protein